MRHGRLLPAVLGVCLGLLDFALYLSGLELLGILISKYLEDL